MTDTAQSTDSAQAFRRMIEAVEWPPLTVVEVNIHHDGTTKSYEFSNGPEGFIDEVLDAHQNGETG